MRPPVEHVRVSAKGKEILIKVRRRTGLEHWNEICRIALCKSLSNNTCPTLLEKSSDSSIDMDWKTFAGRYNKELTALVILKAQLDDINTDSISDYFRAHLERGITSLQNSKDLASLIA